MLVFLCFRHNQKQKKYLRLICNKVCYLSVFVWIPPETNAEAKIESQWGGDSRKHQ